MVGIGRNENEIVCTAMSALIHYFTLATVLWMGAEAVLMFQKLIIVFGNITVKYFVIVSLICWRKFLTSKEYIASSTVPAILDSIRSSGMENTFAPAK